MLWLPAWLSTYSVRSCTLLQFLSVDTIRYYVQSYMCSDISLYSQTDDLHRNGFPDNDERIVCEVCRYSRKHFWRFRKIRKSGCYLQVHPSVCIKQLGTGSTKLYEIRYSRIFRKPVLHIRVWLKSDESNGYLTWRPFSFIINSRWILRGMSSVSDINCIENQNTLCSVTFSENCSVYKVCVFKCGRTGQATDDVITRRVRFTWWITRATDTNSKRNAY